MEEPLRIQIFERIPSAEEFTFQIELRNVPAVFRGCAKDWKAFSKWNVLNGGLDYLQALVASSVVEAILSRTAPTFYGYIRSHDRNKSDSPNSTPLLRKHDLLQQDDDFDSGVPQQVYLAQVSILNRENKERVQLEALREDIGAPAILEGKMIDSANLWMNNARTRSSTHYDPHHNLLCIVSGYKQGSFNQDSDLNNQAFSVKKKWDKDFHCMNWIQTYSDLSINLSFGSMSESTGVNQLVNGSADLANGMEKEADIIATGSLFNLEEDPIANIIWNLDPRTFQCVFLTIAHNFPRTLEDFVLGALCPVGVEVLNRKFEQLDQVIHRRSSSAMNALLNGKESFACKAFHKVLAWYLGIDVVEKHSGFK